jgi:hypothetical protein
MHGFVPELVSAVVRLRFWRTARCMDGLRKKGFISLLGTWLKRRICGAAVVAPVSYYGSGSGSFRCTNQLARNQLIGRERPLPLLLAAAQALAAPPVTFGRVRGRAAYRLPLGIRAVWPVCGRRRCPGTRIHAFARNASPGDIHHGSDVSLDSVPVRKPCSPKCV